MVNAKFRSPGAKVRDFGGEGSRNGSERLGGAIWRFVGLPGFRINFSPCFTGFEITGDQQYPPRCGDRQQGNAPLVGDAAQAPLVDLVGRGTDFGCQVPDERP